MESTDSHPPTLIYVNTKAHVRIERKNLPHWNQDNCVQFVTFRLADSLPQSRLREFVQLRKEWLKNHPLPWDKQTQSDYARIFGQRVCKWLDANYGTCLLKDVRARQIVEQTLLRYHGVRYTLHAYVIMPNHVHVLLSLQSDADIRQTVSGWKRFSAREINRLYARRGLLWERESFDHLVRNATYFEHKLQYILQNPRYLPSDAYTLVNLLQS